MKSFQPMLATDADLDKLRFPLIASPKLDGVRAIVIGGKVHSRSLKHIPNKHVQSLFANHEYLDGELIVGEPTSKSVYRDTVSEVMAHDKTGGATFYVFDYIGLTPMASYFARAEHLKNYFGKDYPNVKLLESVVILNMDELVAYEEKCLDAGYEGLILRDPDAPYKYGRSTAKEGYLLKMKRFLDDEAKVIGFEERMHNGNEATTNELGRTKRSSHTAGKTGRGDLGALIVTWNGATFNIGTGLDDSERLHIWSNKDKYLNKLVKFKYFPVGVKDLPRHPVFLGWRDGRDL